MVQETYCRIMRHPEAIKFEAVARAYLFQTATNVAREYYRRRKRRHAHQHVGLDEVEMESDGLLPEQDALWQETLARLKAEVNAMPPEWRDVVLLHRFQNRTYTEIAAALNVSTRTIERRMSEAMEFLAARLRGAL
jgi:RNA polymerase sigma-70 factor (ECF subfamily)